MSAAKLEDDWEPISLADLESRLKIEVAALPDDLVNTFKGHATAIVEQPCFRSEGYGTERVFVIARSGTRLLIFDDVEDEFAIGVSDEGGVLRDWSLYGDLMDALRAF